MLHFSNNIVVQSWIGVIIILFCFINLKASLIIYRRQQYVGKVRFSHFDTHVQSSKKVLLATENNVFAAVNTRTGELGKSCIVFSFMFSH